MGSSVVYLDVHNCLQSVDEDSVVIPTQIVATTEVKKSFIRRNHQLHVRRRDVMRMTGVRPLLAGQSLGQIGDAAMSLVMAQMLLFTEGDDSVRASLLLSIVMLLPVMLFIGPLAGVLVDRLDRRQILVVGHVARGVLVLGQIAALQIGNHHSAVVIYGLTLAVSRLLYSARVTSVVNLVRRHELPAVDSLSFIIGMISALVGGGLAAALVDINWQLALAISASCQLAAGVTLCKLRMADNSGDRHARSDGGEALRNQVNASKIRFAIGSTTSLRLLLGLSIATVALRVGDQLKLEAFGFAALLAFISCGNFLGSVTAEWFIERFRRRSIAVMAAVASSISMAISLAANMPAVHVLAVAFCAFAFQNLRICTDSSVQANTMDGALGRIFAAYDALYNVAYAVGILSGVLIFGVVPMLLVIGAVIFAYVAVAVVLLSGTETVTIRSVPSSTVHFPVS